MTLSSDTQLFFKLCSDHLSIEAIPKSKLKVDLSKLRKGVDEFRVMMWTPHFVVIKGLRGEEITLRKDGRMIVRNSGSEARAQAAANRVLLLVNRL
jgi:hypothetical protein